MNHNQNDMNKKFTDNLDIFSKNKVPKDIQDEEHSYKTINSNIDILFEPNIKMSKTNISLENRDKVFMDVTDNINPKKDLYNLKTRELININNIYHNNKIFNINNKNSFNFNQENFGEVNIYDLGLSGIKDDNIKDKSEKYNIVDNKDIFSLKLEDSEKNVEINKSEIISTELKSINSTFNLWGLNFDLQEFLNIKDEYYLRKLIFILKSLLIQKQNDDIINLERSRSLIAFELTKKNLEMQIEKLSKNILDKEEKLKKQNQEKEEKMRQLEKKLKEKEDEFKNEKLKLNNLLECERNNNQKAKFKFSQLLIQMKNKEKDFDILNQKLMKILNNNNSDSNINVKVPNSNINSLPSKKSNDIDFSEFFAKKHNCSSIIVSKNLDSTIFAETFKKSFCFYVNVILDRKAELQKSLQIKKNQTENHYEKLYTLNQSKNQDNLKSRIDCDISINNIDFQTNFDYFFNKDKSLLDAKNTDSVVQEINPINIKINPDDLFMPSKVITKDKNYKLIEFSSYIFDLKLEAKSEALKIIEILHDTILQINQQLFSLALNKLTQKDNLKRTIFGNYGLKKSIFGKNEEEEEIKKCFEKLIRNEKLYYMYDSKDAETLRYQILENLKICENLYISFEKLKAFENPQNFINQNNLNKCDDFQLVFLKNEVGDYFERVLLDAKIQENKFLDKLLKEKITGEQKDDMFSSIQDIKNINDIFNKIPSLKIFLNHKGKTVTNTKGKSYHQQNVSSFETNSSVNFRNNNYLNILDEMIEERKRELNSFLPNKQKDLNDPKNLFEIPQKFEIDHMEIIENQISKEDKKDDERENNEKDSILNEFSFNQKYFDNQINNKSLNSTNIFQKEEKNYLFEENQEYPKLLIKKHPRNIHDKIYDNFSLYVYLCIKSNESYIDYFKMFLENEKIELTKNFDFDYNVTNKMNEENTFILNHNKNNLYKIQENSEYREENKLAFYYNFQNMLSSLIDTNSKAIKEINESFNKNYEFIFDGIIEYEKNISRLQLVNNNLKKSLNFLDERFEFITSHSFK